MDKGSRQNRSVTLGKGLALKAGVRVCCGCHVLPSARRDTHAGWLVRGGLGRKAGTSSVPALICIGLVPGRAGQWKCCVCSHMQCLCWLKGFALLFYEGGATHK